MKKVAVHLATGFEEVEALSIVDVLRRAEIGVDIVSVTGGLLVTGGHQITVKADTLFEEVDYQEVGMIVLPGGKEGAENLYAHEGLRKHIQDFFDAGKPLGAICAAPMVLGRMGLLKGIEATSYPAFRQYLTGAKMVDKPAVRDNHVVTSKGIGTALHFALEIVAMLKSRDLANELKEKMVMP